MKTIKWHIETGLQGAEWSGEFEIEEEATEAEIDVLVREEVGNIITWTWWEDRDPPKEAQ